MIQRVISAIAIVALNGCAADYDAAMNIKNGTQSEILMGTFDGSMALVHGSPKNASISLTNGKLTCVGNSTTGRFSTDMSKNKVKHLFNMECDDGRIGQLMASLTASSFGYGVKLNGIGIGTLSDGSKMRVVFGDMSGTLAW